MSKSKRKTFPAILIFTFLFIFGLFNSIWSSPLQGQQDHQPGVTNIHHELVADITPSKQFIKITDTITIPSHSFANGKRIHFLLHGNLDVQAQTPGIDLKKETGELKAEFFGINTAAFDIEKNIPINHYSIKAPAFSTAHNHFTFTINYSGKIHHPIKQVGQEYARGFSQTPGIIDTQGVYLSGSSFWVPWFNDDVITFKLNVTLPQDWSSLSQGTRTLHKKNIAKTGDQTQAIWDSPEPMDEIYLVCGKFKEYHLKVKNVDVMAFLRSETAEDSLANKYLETTGQYVEMYEKLIGPYPYTKFALVENFWETGYGMPSFTLLGPKVIRFPFILHSSYPHELLHNWWGNSVYVNYEKGNWCEGITVYQADHLIKEQRGQGTEYRKNTLQSYTDYAAGKKEEFPLSKFRARYNALSSSIGYGKSMMLYHMLRIELGDKNFNKAIRYFYKKNKFRRASFEDLQEAFEVVCGKDYGKFFQQWVQQTGIPKIRPSGIKINNVQSLQNDPGKPGYRLEFTLNQEQDSPPYSLNIPIAIFLQGQPEAIIKMLQLDTKKQGYTFEFPAKPIRLHVDPYFDVCRILHQEETTPTLSKIFGAKKILILLPSQADPAFIEGYKKLAETWAKDSAGKIEIKNDKDVKTLPTGQATWLFGKENIHNASAAAGLAGYGATFNQGTLTIGKNTYDTSKASLIATVPHPGDTNQVAVLLSTDQVAALPGLGRKLPHYGKYSYLGFEGDEPANFLKGEWESKNSPMIIQFPVEPQEETLSFELPSRQPLATLAPLFSADNMLQHIRYLASEELEGRGNGSKGIIKASAYIANRFKEAGLQPGGDENSYFQAWRAPAGKNGSNVEMRNVIGILPGTDPQLSQRTVILCAHYDHLGLGWPVVHTGDEGKIHYGADDNASGTAVLLELAERLGKNFKPGKTILFIAFSGEESGRLGSKYYLDNLSSERIKRIDAVVNLDTVGRLPEPKGKLMVLGGSSAREWRFIFMGIGYTTGIETQLITQELDASDQASFIEKGIPAIQLFTGPHADYHRPTDTVDKINPAGLVKVAAAARETIVYLSNRKEPLTVTIPGKGKNVEERKATAPGGSKQRRVGTGVMPDFSFNGKGVKAGAVMPGSAAEKAGLQKGDIIIKIGGKAVENLRQYAGLLKAYQPGDTVECIYLREGKEITTKITLTER